MKKLLMVISLSVVLMTTGCMQFMGIETKEDAHAASALVSDVDNELVGLFTKAYLKYQVDPESLADEEWDLMYKVYLYTEALPEEQAVTWSPFEVISKLPEFEEIEVSVSDLSEFKKMTLDSWEEYFTYIGEPVG